MNARKRQSLRDLLACASRVQASPGFCQKVTLRARQTGQYQPHSVRSSPILSLSSVAAAAIVLLLSVAVLLRPSRDGAESAFAQDSRTEEFEGIVLRDELLALNDPAQLDEEAFAHLLFR